MLKLVELLKSHAGRGVGPVRERATKELADLGRASGLEWQDLVVESTEEGWRLVVESTYESGRVEIVIPRDRTADVEIREDTRGDSEAYDYDELYRRGRYEEAARVAERALVVLDEAGTEDVAVRVPAILRVAAAYTKLAKFNRAEMLYDQALEMREQSDLPDDEVTVRLMTASGELAYRYRCNDEQEFAETESRFRRAMNIAEAVLPPGHAATSRILTGLARLRMADMRLEDADDLVNRAINVATEAHGDDHPDVAEALLVKAKLHTAREQDEAARDVLERVLEIRERHLGPDHPDVAEVLFNLADVVHYGFFDANRAAELMTRGLDVWERSLGLDHPLVREQSDFLRVIGPDGGDEDE